MGQAVSLLDLDALGCEGSLDGVVVLLTRPLVCLLSVRLSLDGSANLVIADGDRCVYDVADGLDLLLEGELLLGSRLNKGLLLLLEVDLLLQQVCDILLSLLCVKGPFRRSFDSERGTPSSWAQSASEHR